MAHEIAATGSPLLAVDEYEYQAYCRSPSSLRRDLPVAASTSLPQLLKNFIISILIPLEAAVVANNPIPPFRYKVVL